MFTEYYVTVVYRTQRDRFTVSMNVKGLTPDHASYYLIGSIMNYEKKHKNRYLKIESYKAEEVENL